MNDAALKTNTQQIVVEETFPHAPETLSKTLITSELRTRLRAGRPVRLGRQRTRWADDA